MLTVTVEAGGISKSQARKVTVYGANPAPLAVYDFNATESAPAGTLGEGVEKCVKGMGAYEGETVFESGRSGREGDFAVRTEEGKYGLKLPQKLQQNFTVSLWVKATVLPHWASSVLFVGRKTPETWISIGGNSNGNLICWSSGNRRNGSAKIEANQWTMFTLVQAAINKGNASESEVSSALRNLNEAISRLLVRGDKTSLNKQIAEAESLEESDYTKESWAALGKALAAAKAVQEEADALQNEVNDKAAALREARLALKIAAFTVTLDPANGEAPTVEHIVSGQLISEPEDPSRAGYAFTGWYVGDTLYEFGAPVITDVTIIAKWADLPSIAGASVKVEKAVYNGKARKPEVAVRMDGKLLVETIDYTVSYSNHVKVGQGTITITGIEGYTGKKIVKFNILPAKVKNVKLTAKKGGKAAVKFTKAAGVKGYQVTYSASSSFKSAKNKNITKNSVTLGGLKRNKAYYVKVRAYTIVNGKKVYGSYSTKVKVKIKK